MGGTTNKVGLRSGLDVKRSKYFNKSRYIYCKAVLVNSYHQASAMKGRYWPPWSMPDFEVVPYG